MKRREFLGSAALATAGSLLTRRVVFADTAGQSRLVVIVMRGAVDGLSAVPPVGDPDYVKLRGALAIATPGAADGALKLDGLFGLHPAFSFLQQSYVARELVVCHAVASGYRERSHFDGQNVLESGGVMPGTLDTGWLNRALDSLPRGATGGAPAVALGANVPLLLRGPVDVTSWSPTRLTAVDDDSLQRVAELYAGDPLLSKRLGEALAADAIARGTAEGLAGGMSGDATGMKPPARANRSRYDEVARAAAGFLRHDHGPRLAVFDTTGWDTHANEGGARGQLAQRFLELDAGLRTLKEQSGPAWRNTAVIAITEFGRTAAVNGTGGSDHGTGTVALLLGGAVNGGRMLADWPGLSQRALYQQRDLAPTLDLRAVLKGVLADHMGVPQHALDDEVFPDSGTIRPVRDLIRA